VVDLENVHIRQFDRWRGKFMIAGVGKLHMEADQISFNKSIYNIRKLVVDKPEYRELKRYGLWSAADSIGYYTKRDALAKADTIKKPPTSMVLVIKNLQLKNGIIEFYNRQRVPSEEGVFDTRDIVIGDLGGTIKNLTLSGNTLQAQADIHAKERSGLNIKRIRTRLKIDPNQMEFAKLDLQLNDSRLGDYYAMRYRSIDDMGQFIDSVRITARLKNSIVSVKRYRVFCSCT
jgi:phage pi2 protein 07